jgi:hypothetical protein
VKRQRHSTNAPAPSSGSFALLTSTMLVAGLVGVCTRPAFGAEPAGFKPTRPPSAAALTPALPSANSTTPSNSPPELSLTGIVDLSPKKWACLLRLERGLPAKPYTLREGESMDGVEVLAIDAPAGKVTVRNAGVPMVLTFLTHGRPAAEQTLLAEQKFVEDHVRAHELHQQRERDRIEQERAAVAQLQTPTPEPWPFLPQVSSATFTPDGKAVLTTSPDGMARIWDTTTGKPAGAPSASSGQGPTK